MSERWLKSPQYLLLEASARGVVYYLCGRGELAAFTFASRRLWQAVRGQSLGLRSYV